MLKPESLKLAYIQVARHLELCRDLHVLFDSPLSDYYGLYSKIWASISREARRRNNPNIELEYAARNNATLSGVPLYSYGIPHPKPSDYRALIIMEP